MAAWGALTIILGASLNAPHLLAFRAPSAASARDVALAALRPADSATSATWTAVHVLYGACRCSARILDHLQASDRPRGMHEVVLWVGEERGGLPTIAARGFRVIPIDEGALARDWHIESVPLLVAIDPHGSVRYAGGYAGRKQAAAIRDIEILTGAREGSAPLALPLFGCAMSEKLRASFDILSR